MTVLTYCRCYSISHLLAMKQYKCMVILRDFPYTNASHNFKWVQYNVSHAPFGRGPTTPVRGLTVTRVAKYLLNGRILQVPWKIYGSLKMLVSKFKYLFLQKNIQGCTTYHSVKTNLGSSYKVRPEITNMFRYLKWRH